MKSVWEADSSVATGIVATGPPPEPMMQADYTQMLYTAEIARSADIEWGAL